MTSLYDRWQQQRQHRQQQTVQRQQAVQHELATHRQLRHQTTAQLRQTLSHFRQGLAQSDRVRQLESQLWRSQRAQFHLQLTQETQAFLTATSAERQAQAVQLAQELEAFVQALRHQSADFLNLTAAERLILAQQVDHDLQQFRRSLQANSLILHQSLQAEAAHRHQETQQFLAGCRQQRQQSAQQTQQDLAQSRQQRYAEVQGLFARLAAARATLQQFHAALRQTVWGDPAAFVSHPATPQANSSRSAMPVRQSTAIPAAAAPKSMPVAGPSLAQLLPKPVVQTPGAFQNGNSITVVPAKLEPAKSEPAAVAYEKEVYNHIHKVQGARLTEIEAALGINRFQTVDALRSLIQKGLITQRDRVYLVQENLMPI